MRVSPLRPWQILASHAVTQLAMSAVGVVLLVRSGCGAFDLNLPASVGRDRARPAAVAASMVAIGFLLGAVLPTVRTTQAVAAAMYFPAIFVSGALFPRELLPGSRSGSATSLPMTYAVGAIREAWTVRHVDWAAFGMLAGTTVVRP